MIYIAGAFFNEEQLALIKSIETECEKQGVPYFSPRLVGGVLQDMTQEERDKAKRDIYNSNVQGIEEADCVLAVIDDFDPGTMFELGYAAAFYKDIVTVTNKNYGLNVMLNEPVRCHTSNVRDAVRAVLNQNFIGEEVKVTT